MPGGVIHKDEHRTARTPRLAPNEAASSWDRRHPCRPLPLPYGPSWDRRLPAGPRPFLGPLASLPATDIANGLSFWRRRLLVRHRLCTQDPACPRRWATVGRRGADKDAGAPGNGAGPARMPALPGKDGAGILLAARTLRAATTRLYHVLARAGVTRPRPVGTSCCWRIKASAARSSSFWNFTLSGDQR